MTSPSPAIGASAFVDAVTTTQSAPSGAGSRELRIRQGLTSWAGLVPFFVFLGLFLVVPTISVFVRAFGQTEGSDVPAMREAMSGLFPHYFWESLKLSFITAVVGGLLGTMLALVVVRMQRPRWLRNVVTAFSGVAANMGGIVLAFAFIAALGTQGLATKVLKTIGFELPSQYITTSSGLVVVYSFFQIPLMFLVMLPAIDGLKPAWREAVANLGGTAITYWRRVGIPVLTPAALGGMLLLFANAFAAYATAFALSTGSAELVPVQIPLLPPGRQHHRQGQHRLRPRGVDDPHHAGHDRHLPVVAAPSRTLAAVVSSRIIVMAARSAHGCAISSAVVGRPDGLMVHE